METDKSYNDQKEQQTEAEKILGSMPSFEEHMLEQKKLEDFPDTERTVENLRAQAIDMMTAQEGVLAPDFKSSVYLFHSAPVEGIEDIIRSGEILCAGEIYARKKAAKREELAADGKSEEEIENELKKVSIRRNSGQEGISWSVNGIDAMPGTQGRIAGFVAAPELILDDDKLVVPSRPAPYELLQVSGEVDAKELFEAKKQYEVWGYERLTFGETAAVESGLLSLWMNASHKDEPDKYGLWGSCLKDFAERGGLSADKLREHFETSEDGHIKLDDDLHQQKFDENYMPPAAVFMQAIIDRGDFSNTALKEKSVAEIINVCREDPELIKFMIGLARQEGKQYADKYEAGLKKAEGVSARVEDMYFVTSHKDLDGWLDVMKEAGHMPRGILLYNDEKVVKINFASDEKGDHEELAGEIGRVVGADTDFWSKKMGMDLTSITRAGHKGQVLKDSEVNHDAEVKMVGGSLEVVKV